MEFSSISERIFLKWLQFLSLILIDISNIFLLLILPLKICLIFIFIPFLLFFIKVFDIGPEGGDQEIDGDVLIETDEIPYECGARLVLIC